MRIKHYVCATPTDLILARSQLPADAEILYQTPDADAETGDMTRQDVTDGVLLPATGLGSFGAKYLLVARV